MLIKHGPIYGLTQRVGGESVLEQIERYSPHYVWWQLVPQVDDAREEGVLVGVDAAGVLLQLQMVATGCRVGVNDIRWTGWDGYKLVMDVI